MTASEDHTWAFHNIESGATLAHVRSPKVTSAISSAHLHPRRPPHGLRLQRRLRGHLGHPQPTVAAALGAVGGHTGGVRSIRCSENGFYLVSAAADLVKLWDLRTCKAVAEAAVAGATSQPSTLPIPASTSPSQARRSPSSPPQTSSSSRSSETTASR
eukprot:TRINITY_DN15025_c0_g1_i1.p1 TRINITY_DN15025_c0_g1~~TRINITY_DN15025_c0_g1_i1.p1  ORF type:complete len:158 (+),score=7.35 TRINITY_DN15025_c0_g1_i1:2-475(+)